MHSTSTASATGPAGAPSPSIASRPGSLCISPDQPVATGSSGEPLLNPRSCVTCRRRHVRCDKQMPCSNCRRATIQCIYPAPGRAPRRQKPRDPNAPSREPGEREDELIKRLRKLEGIVEELSGQIDADAGEEEEDDAGEDATASRTNYNGRLASSSGTSPEAPQGGDGNLRATAARNSSLGTQSSHSGAPGNAKSAGRKDTGSSSGPNSAGQSPNSIPGQLGRLVLHDEGRTSRYVSPNFWSRLNDELDALRNDMTLASDDESDEMEGEDAVTEAMQPDTSGSDHHGFLLGYRSVDVDLSGLHPLPEQLPFLWRVYLENVEPLVKVLHIPTVEKIVWRPSSASLRPADEALLFSIYYATVVSMEDDEVHMNFGNTKAHYMSQCRFAFEQALAKANFLTSSDMVVLQAFTIFLTVMRRHDNSRLCWTLTALCTRIAVGLGIHRDGVQLGLPPFEVEMRRRLWWAIVALDRRSAEELGTEPSVNDRTFDTHLPLNLNDEDIYPGMPELPEPRVGRTDCACSLVRWEIASLGRRLNQAGAETGPPKVEDIPANIEAAEGMLIEVHDRIEEQFLKNCVVDTDPLFWMVSIVCRIIMAKCGLVLYQPYMFPGSGTELSDDIRDRLFLTTIEIVEYSHILNTDHRCRQWRWFFETYKQWHAIAYMLLELSRRPWGPSSERAWEAAQILGHGAHRMNATGEADHTAVWIPFKKLYFMARKHRQMECERLRKDPDAVRALDVQDRMTRLPERLGPVPGMENKPAQLRTRWRRLVRPDHDVSRVQSAVPWPDLSRSARQVASTTPPGVGGIPMPSAEELEQQRDAHIAEVVLGPTHNVSEMWRFALNSDVSDMGGGPTSGTNSGLLPTDGSQARSHSGSVMPSSGVPGSTGPDQYGNPVAAAAFAGSGASQHQEDPGARRTEQREIFDYMPPWAWSTQPAQVEEPPYDDQEDMDMDIPAEFDWQTFQEQLKGLEKPGIEQDSERQYWGQR